MIAMKGTEGKGFTEVALDVSLTAIKKHLPDDGIHDEWMLQHWHLES
ncbi:hypothetical protein ACSFXN_07410 [Planococcus sp. 1R117A]